MATEDTIIGKVAVSGSEIYIRPSDDPEAIRMITYSLENVGILPVYINPRMGGVVPDSLKDDDGDKYVIRIGLQAWAQQGDQHRLDLRKAKDNFTAVDGKDVTFRQLIEVLTQSLVLETKEIPGWVMC